MVSERGADPALERDVGSGVAFADYDGLVDRCVELLGDERARRELAERGYQAFSARDQAAIVHRALSADLEGATHETAARADPRIDAHLEGKDDSADQQLRDRQLFRHKFVPDRDLWLGKVERNPEDARSVFFLAETSFQLDDFVNARKWYARRVEMAGSDEEAYWAMYRLAESMSKLGEPWPEIQEAYLKAWEFRPTRAEALHAIAFRCRVEQRYWLGYLFAQRAAEIPFPEEDLFVLGYFAEVYAWRATDEQAMCAFWIGKHAEAFTLCRRLVARPDIPEGDRQRIATNRDYSVPAMIEAAAPYPETLVQSLPTAPGEAEVTVSLIAGPDRQITEQTINSFLTCCLDVSRVGRFLVLDTGLSAPDRAKLRKRYGFSSSPNAAPSTSPPPNSRSSRSDQRTVLAAPGRRLAVFRPREFHHPPHRSARRRTAGVSGGHQLRRRGQTDRRLCRRGGDAPGTRHRPLPADRGDGQRPGDVRHRTPGPSHRVHDNDPAAPTQRRRPPTRAGLRTASLDEVLCISGPEP